MLKGLLSLVIVTSMMGRTRAVHCRLDCSASGCNREGLYRCDRRCNTTSECVCKCSSRANDSTDKDTAPLIPDCEVGDAIFNRLPEYWKVQYKPRLPDVGRYVFFRPHLAGQNNLRASLEVAVALAYLTNRTLVIPDSLSMEHQKKPYHFFDDLDERAMAGNIAIITEDEFYHKVGLDGKLWGNETLKPIVVRKRRPLYYYNSSYLILDYTTNWYPRRVICYPNMPVTVDEWNDARGFAHIGKLYRWPTKGNAARVIYLLDLPAITWYTTFWLKTRAAQRDLARVVRDSVRYRPEIFGLAVRAVACLGNFSCVHVRRGDFLTTYPRLTVSPELTVKATRKLLLQNEKVFLISDEKSPLYYKSFESTFGTSLMREHDVWKNLAQIERGPAMQLVCSLGRVFAGTTISTFSSYITRLRGYSRQPTKWISHDGSVTWNMNVLPPPKYTWQRPDAIGIILAFWTVEYPESWFVGQHSNNN